MHNPDLNYCKTGAVSFRLPESPFMVGMGQKSATVGKVFIIRIFEEMFRLGYDFVACSDLSRTNEQGSLFFKKCNVSARANRSVLCVAPGERDTIVLVRCPDNVQSAIRQSISETWTRGIQGENNNESFGETVTKIKLKGYPWIGTGDETTECRKLLMSITENLQKLHWRFHAIANVKGGTDSLFFMYNPELQRMGRLSMLSLNRTDRLRLINFESDPEVVEAVAQSLKKTNGNQPDIKDYHGTTEFKVKGKPFFSSGYESIKCREMIVGVLQVLRQRGYAVLTGIDVSRKSTDKSSVIFRKCNSTSEQHACISLNGTDKMWIINFPAEVSKSLELAIQQHYLPGIKETKEKSLKASCCQLKLKEMPWSSAWTFVGYGIHGKSMLAMLLKEANKLGWKLVASLDVSSRYHSSENSDDYPEDVHSWFFQYTTGNITRII